MFTQEFYPNIEIARNVKGNRFYAFPLIGILAKVIILIPVFFYFIALNIVAGILAVINSFIVLFTGKYWDTALSFIKNFITYNLKISFFFSGLTDKYPGFSFTADFTVDIPNPEKPKRFFAIPVIGGLVRILFLIPYSIYQQVISNGANLGVVGSFFQVLTKGIYPEATHEFFRDSTRVAQGASCYMFGLSDKYPSFKIDLTNHRSIKIALIILGILFYILNFTNSFISKPETTEYKQTDFMVNYQTQAPQTSQDFAE